VRFATLLVLALAALAAAPAAADTAERPLSLSEAITMSLQRNDAIIVEREALVAADAAVGGARGAYDPLLEVNGQYRRATDPVNSSFSGAPAGDLAPTVRTEQAGATLSQLIATGATVSVTANTSRTSTNSEFTFLSPAYTTDVGVTFRQPLLRNRSVDPARSGLRVAASDRRRAGASLRREVSESVASVERAYWTLVAARRELGVREESVRLATEQLEETKIRVEGGSAPETELSQPRAEVERRRGELFASREAAARAESALKLLILGGDEEALWSSRLVPLDDPEVEIQSVDVTQSMATALASRPEVEAATAVIERRKVESALARDTVHPSLDAVVSLQRFGLSGWRNSGLQGFSSDPNNPSMGPPVPQELIGGWGRSVEMLRENRYSDVTAGFQLRVPIGDRAARADAAIARSVERQAETDLTRVRKDVRAEVLNAAAALETAGQRIEASRAARESAEVQLSAERDRFSAGLSTNFLVLTRQNDLSRARLDEISARIDYRKALTEMARATGVLLKTRKIDIEETSSFEGSQENGNHG